MILLVTTGYLGERLELDVTRCTHRRTCVTDSRSRALPGTVFLHEVLTGDFPTERCHNDHFFVQAGTELVPRV